jgi:hypothetical protein
MYSGCIANALLECPSTRGNCDLLDYFTEYESEESEDEGENQEIIDIDSEDEESEHEA